MLYNSFLYFSFRKQSLPDSKGVFPLEQYSRTEHNSWNSVIASSAGLHSAGFHVGDVMLNRRFFAACLFSLDELYQGSVWVFDEGYE